jgi:ATP adenylyltransferase
MKYVTQASGKSAPKSCLFCDLKRRGDDEAHLVLARRRSAYLMLNAFPYTSGHLIVAIHRHVGNIGDLTAAERRDLWELAALGEFLLEEVYHPEGFNAGLNLGRSAGAGIDGHLHLHIVPRWHGDTNFMTTCGDTRVLPEDLGESYRRLAAALSGTGAGRRQQKGPVGRTGSAGPKRRRG